MSTEWPGRPLADHYLDNCGSPNPRSLAILAEADRGRARRPNQEENDLSIAWNWRKNSAPAARIIVRHVVSIKDMVQALCWWAAIEDDDPLPDTMTTAEIEVIVRRTYEHRGSAWTEQDWSKDLTAQQSQDLERWATAIVAHAWPRHAASLQR